MNIRDFKSLNETVIDVITGRILAEAMVLKGLDAFMDDESMLDDLENDLQSAGLKSSDYKLDLNKGTLTIKKTVPKLKDIIRIYQLKEEVTEIDEAAAPSVISMDSSGKSGMLWGKKITGFDNGGISLRHDGYEIQIFADMKKGKIKKGFSRIMPDDSEGLSRKDMINMLKKDYPGLKDDQIGRKESNRGMAYFPLNNISMEMKEEVKDNVQKALQHDCAKHVIHEELGYGVCIRDSHIMEENEDGTGTVTHYDVVFENGKRYNNIPVKDLEVTFFESHMGSGKKKKK